MLGVFNNKRTVFHSMSSSLTPRHGITTCIGTCHWQVVRQPDPNVNLTHTHTHTHTHTTPSGLHGATTHTLHTLRTTRPLRDDRAAAHSCAQLRSSRQTHSHHITHTRITSYIPIGTPKPDRLVCTKNQAVRCGHQPPFPPQGSSTPIASHSPLVHTLTHMHSACT